MVTDTQSITELGSFLSTAGKLTLVADLGSFIVETDTQTSSKLSHEEAALYECIELVGRNISAYLVDGEFSFLGLANSEGLLKDRDKTLESTQVGILACSDYDSAWHGFHVYRASDTKHAVLVHLEMQFAFLSDAQAKFSVKSNL